METTAIEKRICHSNRSKERGQVMALGWGGHGHMRKDQGGQEAEDTGKHGKEPLVWFPQGRPGEES